MVENSNVEVIEEKLIEHFKLLKRKVILEKKLKMFEEKKEEAEADFKHSRIILPVNYSSITYDGNVVSSYSGSQQEKSVDQAFDRIEKQIQYFTCEISFIKSTLREIETNTAELGFILKELNESEQLYLDYRYAKKKSVKMISYELKLSEASLSRLRINVLEEIYKFIDAKKE